MERKAGVRIGEDFGPVPQYKTLNYIYLILGVVVFVLTWLIPLSIFAPAFVTIIIGVPLVIVLLFIAFWIPLYYKTVKYRLARDEMTWRRGVWFRNTGIVPYNRITNIDISQGPISRSLGMAALKIQTAGYSGTATKTSEIKIEGVRNFEELREMIIGFCRGRKPVAVETYEETHGGKQSQVLAELVKIRKLLEKHRK